MLKRQIICSEWKIVFQFLTNTEVFETRKQTISQKTPQVRTVHSLPDVWSAPTVSVRGHPRASSNSIFPFIILRQLFKSVVHFPARTSSPASTSDTKGKTPVWCEGSGDANGREGLVAAEDHGTFYEGRFDLHSVNKRGSQHDESFFSCCSS